MLQHECKYSQISIKSEIYSTRPWKNKKLILSNDLICHCSWISLMLQSNTKITMNPNDIPQILIWGVVRLRAIIFFIIMFQSLIVLSVNSNFCLIFYFNLPNFSFLLLVIAKPSCLHIQYFLPMMAFIHCNQVTVPFGLHLVSFGLTTKTKYISFLAVQIFF